MLTLNNYKKTKQFSSKLAEIHAALHRFFTLPKKKNSVPQSGFTLVEIMVSVAIFTIIITVGIGSLVSVLGTYEVSQKQKKVHDGLNYALESMIREIRLGKDYFPGANPNLEEEGTIGDGWGTSLGFNATDDRGYVVFYVDDGALAVKRSGATPSRLNEEQFLTEKSQITINDIRFTVIGTETLSSGNYQQPLVWIRIKASATGETRETVVQTLVSQRILDV